MSSTPANIQHCGHCDGVLVWGFDSYVHADPKTDCLAFGGRQLIPSSEPQAVPPPLTVDECLRDLQAWIEFALKGEIKGRQTGDYATGFNSYSYVEIPEWSMRQKLDNITTALTRTSTALAEALRDLTNAYFRFGEAAVEYTRLSNEPIIPQELRPQYETLVDAALGARNVLARWEGRMIEQQSSQDTHGATAHVES